VVWLPYSSPFLRRAGSSREQRKDRPKEEVQNEKLDLKLEKVLEELRLMNEAIPTRELAHQQTSSQALEIGLDSESPKDGGKQAPGVAFNF
jgi:hypothetical protein